MKIRISGYHMSILGIVLFVGLTISLVLGGPFDAGVEPGALPGYTIHHLITRPGQWVALSSFLLMFIGFPLALCRAHFHILMRLRCYQYR
jgi:hypothetical protein